MAKHAQIVKRIFCRNYHISRFPAFDRTGSIPDDFVYGGTGAPKYTAPSGTKDVKVTYKGIGSTSYAESEEVPTAAGTYNVTVVCKTEDSLYSGSADFEITKKPITGAVVTLGESLTYNGSEQTQTVIKVTLDGKDITAFCDVSENTAKKAGGHTLKVTAKGDSNYTSSETAEFTVAKLEISFTATVQDKIYDAEYSGQPQSVTVIAIYGGETLVNETDYRRNCHSLHKEERRREVRPEPDNYRRFFRWRQDKRSERQEQYEI